MTNKINSLVNSATNIEAIKEQVENLSSTLDCADIFPLITEALFHYLQDGKAFKNAVFQVSILQGIYNEYTNNEMNKLLDLTHPKKEKGNV